MLGLGIAIGRRITQSHAPLETDPEISPEISPEVSPLANPDGRARTALPMHQAHLEKPSKSTNSSDDQAPFASIRRGVPLASPLSDARGVRLEDVQQQLCEAEHRIGIQAKQIQEYFQEARTDELTGLLNRRAIEQIAEAEIKKGISTDNPLVIALLDVDHFKGINDRFGHAAGDATLQEVAKFLRQVLPVNANVARFGGEEFAILLRSNLTLASAQLEEIRHGIAQQTLLLDQQSISFTVSIGACQVQSDQRFASAMKNADEALYRAKRRGKNRLMTSD